jgi:hypothetical protein
MAKCGHYIHIYGVTSDKNLVFTWECEIAITTPTVEQRQITVEFTSTQESRRFSVRTKHKMSKSKNNDGRQVDEWIWYVNQRWRQEWMTKPKMKISSIFSYGHEYWESKILKSSWFGTQMNYQIHSSTCLPSLFLLLLILCFVLTLNLLLSCVEVNSTVICLCSTVGVVIAISHSHVKTKFLSLVTP